MLFKYRFDKFDLNFIEVRTDRQENISTKITEIFQRRKNIKDVFICNQCSPDTVIRREQQEYVTAITILKVTYFYIVNAF